MIVLTHGIGGCHDTLLRNRSTFISSRRLRHRRQRSTVLEKKLDNDPEFTIRTLSRYIKQLQTIAIESTFNGYSLADAKLNFYGQGGIYFADTILSGPYDSVSENSNGYLLAVGVEIMLNRYFGFRAEAYNLFEVEDFANDENVSVFNLGGQLVF